MGEANIKISKLFETRRWRIVHRWRFLGCRNEAIGNRSVERRGEGGAAALFSPVAGFGGRQESIERATVVYRKGPVAREEEQRAARVPRRPSREHCVPVRAEFSQPSHLATRAPDTNRGCADTRGGGRKRQRKRRKPATYAYTRARRAFK